MKSETSTVQHPGLPNGQMQVYVGDVEELGSKRLLSLTCTARGTLRFDVSPEGFRYYEEQKRMGAPTERVQNADEAFRARETMSPFIDKLFSKGLDCSAVADRVRADASPSVPLRRAALNLVLRRCSEMREQARETGPGMTWTTARKSTLCSPRERVLFQCSAYPQVVSLQDLSPPWVACRQPYPGFLERYSAGMLSTPWQMMLVALAGWINEQQRGVIYLKEENRVLREQLGRRRPRFTDDRSRGVQHNPHSLAACRI